MEDQDDGHNNVAAGPSSPRYAPLSSASLFPPPPPTHIHFTPLNLWLHKVLNEHWDDSLLAKNDGAASSSLSPRMQLQRTLLLKHAPDALSKAPPDVASQHDAASLREYITTSLCIDLKLEMDPPDLSVVTRVARGYNLYGQWWPVPSLLPGLKEAGIQRLYPDDEDVDAVRDEEGRIDRRPSLLLLLRSFMATYLKLLSLLQYPPSYYSLRSFARDTLQEGQGDEPTNTNGNGNGHAHPSEADVGEVQWQTTTSAQWTHLRTLVLNFQEVLNRARPHQAAVNLERLVEEQLREKRRKTRELREKCRGVREMIARWEGEAKGRGKEGGMGVRRLPKVGKGEGEEMDVDLDGDDAQGAAG